jgi:hypothetical protein
MRVRASFVLPGSILLLLVGGALACGGSDDGVSFAPGNQIAKAGNDAGEPADGGGGEGGGEEGGGPAEGGSSAGGAAGASGKASSGGKGGASGGSAGKADSAGNAGSAGSGASGGAGVEGGEDTVERCTDGLDNDADGFVDCRDNDCRALLPACREDTAEACSDGLDNDQDGHVDCDDFDCQKPESGAGCEATASCTDEHEPNDAVGTETTLDVLEGDGSACSENHSICTGDRDRFSVRFEALASGGTLDLRLRVFSQGDGAPVVVTMRDPSGKAPTVTKTLPQTPETLKLLYDTAIVCGGTCEGPVVRELEVTHVGSAKLFYRVCGAFL